MPNYTIERVDQAKSFTTKDGHELVSYTVLLKGEDGTGDIAQRNMKPDSKAPAAGDTWDCTLEPNGNFPKKVKMTQKPFGGGGGKSYGKSPEELADGRANSALIRAYEFYQLQKNPPSITDFLKTAQTIHTASLRLAKAEGK